MAAATAAAVAANKRKKDKDANGEGGGAAASSGSRLRRTVTSLKIKSVEENGIPLQDFMYKIYHHDMSQKFVALLIVINFVVNIVEKEVDPAGTLQPQTWKDLEDAFNVIFLVELLINFWGSFFVPFFKSGWNLFDLLVVAVGCLSLLRIELPPQMSLLRILRAFRVFRLFKRVQSLNKIITSLANAVPGVTNAFVIMIIVMCIYAIVAVDFFSTHGIGGTYVTSDGAIVESGTARGYDYGLEYFGTFSRAAFTLWQVQTGESWSEAVARPLIFGWNAGVAGLYFTSFIIIQSIVMINVVVAVLLEKMVTPEDAAEESEVVAEPAEEAEVPAEEGLEEAHNLPRPPPADKGAGGGKAGEQAAVKASLAKLEAKVEKRGKETEERLKNIEALLQEVLRRAAPSELNEAKGAFGGTSGEHVYNV